MKADWITIDGGVGEGGGQILRSSLALSLVTNRPLRMHKIRAGRNTPGLLRQHLTALRAAATVGGARVTGDCIGSQELEFVPGAADSTPVESGDANEVATGENGARNKDAMHRFAVGSAGSATLVLQTILPALLTGGDSRSTKFSTSCEGFAAPDQDRRLLFAGGTHNPFAPPFEFLEQAYLPLVRRMRFGSDSDSREAAPELHLRLIRPGFYPAGGGEFELTLAKRAAIRSDGPGLKSDATGFDARAEFKKFELLERGALRELSAVVLSANLPNHVGRREYNTIREHPAWRSASVEVRRIADAPGPGNAVLLFARFENLTEVFVDFGRQGKPAEAVATHALASAESYLQCKAAVGEFLADQLLLPLALSGGGRFSTVSPSSHTLTNIEVIRRFLEISIRCEEIDEDLWTITVGDV